MHMADKVPESSAGFDQAQLFVWVKGLESKVNNMIRELDILKNDYVKKNTDLKKEVKAISADLLEAKRELSKSNEKIDLIIKELKNTAGSDELETIKKYIEFWNPMNFVTQRDLERAIDRKLNVQDESMNETEIKTNKKEKHIPFV